MKLWKIFFSHLAFGTIQPFVLKTVYSMWVTGNEALKYSFVFLYCILLQTTPPKNQQNQNLKNTPPLENWFFILLLMVMKDISGSSFLLPSEGYLSVDGLYVSKLDSTFWH